MTTLELTPEARDDLRWLRKFEQKIIIEGIEARLQSEPATQTRNRKPLRPNDLASWELRIGKYRVFFDIDEKEESIKIKAVGWKEHNKLMIRGREYQI